MIDNRETARKAATDMLQRAGRETWDSVLEKWVPTSPRYTIDKHFIQGWNQLTGSKVVEYPEGALPVFIDDLVRHDVEHGTLYRSNQRIL